MNIVIFSGTTEGRKLSYDLAKQGVLVTVCVATEYGREEQGNAPGIRVISHRMDVDEMVSVLRGASFCVDATHPYAVAATANIKKAADLAGVPYRRLKREPSVLPDSCQVVADADEAAKLLAKNEGNILLTTGSKELQAFSRLDPNRLYPRVLPSEENLKLCETVGIPHRNIIAMQGPFSKDLNLAIIRQFQIRYLVTKDGGAAGGFPEKAQAAADAGISLIVLQSPSEEGASLDSLKTDILSLK